MPWTTADVDSHKKGLSDKQKRQWVHVANSALKRCQGAGESDCDGRAIRQANSVVSKEYEATNLRLCVEATIAKADDAEQRLFGWASIAVQKDGTPLLDLQGDVIDIQDLEAAWYGYVAESGELNFQHRGPVRGHMIEAIVFTPEKLAALGLPDGALPQGAWVGYEIPDRADYDLVKSLGFFMFSIEGEALREPL
jgi:Putative phage serine protease XkdF